MLGANLLDEAIRRFRTGWCITVTPGGIFVIYNCRNVGAISVFMHRDHAVAAYRALTNGAH